MEMKKEKYHVPVDELLFFFFFFIYPFKT